MMKPVLTVLVVVLVALIATQGMATPKAELVPENGDSNSDRLLQSLRQTPAVFNLSDSNSDTGGFVAAIGHLIKPPFGQTHFKKPSGRFSDGRLIIDFLMDAFDLPHLNPYLVSQGEPNFKKGCNFAAAGCTISHAGPDSLCPFSLDIQVNQFLMFKQKAIELSQGNRKKSKRIPNQSAYEKGLYTFDIGQNDLEIALKNNTYEQVIASIPIILAGFEDQIKNLYDAGARMFWIHNTGPLGCLPKNIAIFGSDPSRLDELGCITTHNAAAKFFNLQLKVLCNRIQKLANANVTLVDIFAIKTNLIANYSQYGFKQPTEACCGYGGPPTNFIASIRCSSPKAKACNDPNRYVNWDGVHYTESANRFVASQILSPFTVQGAVDLDKISKPES